MTFRIALAVEGVLVLTGLRATVSFSERRALAVVAFERTKHVTLQRELRPFTFVKDTKTTC
ncbi:hypothetical protein KC906_00065 [Candidatus Kaiserbacteria bacterium]|nr:hypothetical protein [Candidatus Kaiserbacteria bacterium]